MVKPIVILLVAIVCIAAATVPVEFDEECFHIRQVDGTCNNYLNPLLGSGDQYLKRGLEGVRYVDGVREPVLEPNVRTVSNEMFRGDDSVLSPHDHNLFWTFFGQFVTHDLMGVHRKGDLNASEITDSNNSDIWIRVDMNDPTDRLYPVLRPDLPWMRILRSRGDMVNGVFEIGSDSTAFLDLDVVYGKTNAVATLLRGSHTDGLLASRIYNNYTAYPGSGSSVPPTQVAQFGEWLPLFADVDMDRTTVPLSHQLVLQTTRNVSFRHTAAGDGRNGENYALNLIQGLFLREHNRLAREFKAAHPDWSDEMLYQKARRVNIAQYQAIVMYEFLPSLLLEDTSRLGRYTGYSSRVDPTLTHLFAFAFRFGHTTVPNVYSLMNSCAGPAYGSSRDGPRSGQSFAAGMPADQLAQIGNPDFLLQALLYTKGSKVDTQFPESLRTIVGAVADIVAQNQMRAAEHGIPGYNDIRKLWHGIPYADLYNHWLCNADENSPSPDPINCFLAINSNYTVAASLQSLYGKINKINFYTAVVAEEPTRASIGQTSARIVADQFRRVRDGDRWWFEGVDAGFTLAEKVALKRDMRLNVLLGRNFPTAHVQADSFYTPESSFFATC